MTAVLKYAILEIAKKDKDKKTSRGYSKKIGPTKQNQTELKRHFFCIFLISLFSSSLFM